MLGWLGRALRRGDRLTAAVMGLVLLGSSIWFFTIDSGFGYRGPRVDADGIYFFHYLRSLVLDGDVDFKDDYATFGNPWKYPVTETGRSRNPATVGAALMWLPLYLPAHLMVVQLARSGAAVRTDGTSHAEELCAFYGSLLYGFFAMLLALKLCRRRMPRAPALLGSVGAALGGNLLFYMVVQPSYSHAPAAFAVAAFVERWEATAQKRRLGGWLLLGALGGLAMLVRPQLVVLAVLPLSDLVRRLWGLWRAPAAERRWRALLQQLGLAGAGLLAALLVFAPQMWIWQRVYGELIALPQGDSFMQWRASLWPEVLFHPRAGLLPWMPLALPALVGLGLLCRKSPGLGLPLGLLFVLMTYINGATWDWWGGYSFGARRFTSLYVVLALGLASACHGLWRWVEARAVGVARALVVAGVAAFCLLNLSLINNRRHHNIDWYSHRRFYEVYVEGVRGLARGVDESTGNPLSWPGSLAFSARHGVAPRRYDQVAAHYFLDEKHGIAHHGWPKKLRDELRLSTRWAEPFLARGFGKLHRRAGRRARVVLQREACLLLPLIQRPEIKLVLHGGAERPTRLTLRLNGQSLGRRTLSRPWQRIEATARPHQLKRGINELCLEHEPLEPWPAADRHIGGTGVISPVDLAVFSAGRPGNRAAFWVDGQRVGTNQRGINAVALEPKSGHVVGASAFDMCYWPQAPALLRKWVEGLPRGTIVALAVRIDASPKFDADAVKALAAIGAKENLRVRPRRGYAAVGVRGAAAGTALEVARGGRPAVAVVGRKPRQWVGLAHYAKLELLVTHEMAFH